MDQNKQNEIAVAIRTAFNAIADKTSETEKSHVLYEHVENSVGKLVIEFSCGSYYLDNKTVWVNHLMITYLSLESTGDGPEQAWFSNQSQYFHPSLLDAAIGIYIERLNSSCSYRSFGKGDHSVQAAHQIDLETNTAAK